MEVVEVVAVVEEEEVVEEVVVVDVVSFFLLPDVNMMLMKSFCRWWRWRLLVSYDFSSPNALTWLLKLLM